MNRRPPPRRYWNHELGEIVGVVLWVLGWTTAALVVLSPWMLAALFVAHCLGWE